MGAPPGLGSCWEQRSLTLKGQQKWTDALQNRTCLLEEQALDLCGFWYCPSKAKGEETLGSSRV